MAENNEEEMICEYCFQTESLMIDPRELPCKHVFCLPCIKADFSHTTGIKCPVCRRLHKSLDLSSLKSVMEETTCDANPVQIYCFVCEEKVSSGYCITCGQHYCALHFQKHVDVEHETVDMITYTNKPALYTKVLCRAHRREISMCCQRCLMFACIRCDTRNRGCIYPPDSAPQYHQVMSLSSVEKVSRQEIENLLNMVATKISGMYKLEKGEWRKLDNYAGAAGYRVGQDTLLKEVEMNICTVVSMREWLEQVQTTTSQLLRERHITEVIQQTHDIIQLLSDAYNSASQLGGSQLLAAGYYLAPSQDVLDVAEAYYTSPSANVQPTGAQALPRAANTSQPRLPLPLKYGHGAKDIQSGLTVSRGCGGAAQSASITDAAILSAPERERRQLLRERFMPPVIANQYPPNVAEMICDTLVEQSNGELVKLLNSPTLPQAKVEKIAQRVLSRSKRPSMDEERQRMLSAVVQMRSDSDVELFTSDGQEPLTVATLATAPPEEQKQMLGHRLCPLIENLQPRLAGKITGMLLDLGNSEILHLLESCTALEDKVEEAVQVIQRYRTRTSTT